MGLDIYAGTLTRYYAQNWKTINQQVAEQMGANYTKITAEGHDDDNLPSVEEIQVSMEGFANFLATNLTHPEGKELKPWEESNEKPYYTDKPDWLAKTALIYKAAYSEYNMELPSSIHNDSNPSADPVVQKALEEEVGKILVLMHAEWFIPVEGYYNFNIQVPDGRELTLSTVELLLACLDALNEMTWNASEEEIYTWRETEGYAVDSTQGSSHDLESLAKFCFSIYYKAAVYATENKVVVLLDY